MKKWHLLTLVSVVWNALHKRYSDSFFLTMKQTEKIIQFLLKLAWLSPVLSCFSCQLHFVKCYRARYFIVLLHTHTHTFLFWESLMSLSEAEEQGKHYFISTVYLDPSCFSFEHLQNMQFYWSSGPILAVALKTFGMVGTQEVIKNQKMGYVSIVLRSVL